VEWHRLRRAWKRRGVESAFQRMCALSSIFTGAP
jgi:hypothetical protein